METYVTPSENKPEFIRPWPLAVCTYNTFAQFIQVFNPDECKQYIRDAKANERTTTIQKGKVGSETNNENYEIRNSDVCFFRSENTLNSPLFSKLTDIIVNANASFFAYDIFEIEAVQFSEYSSKYDGFYGKHLDIVQNSSSTGVRKLSFSVQLSSPDSYEGGELILHTCDEPTVAPKELGSLILFPSYTLHEVTPVTEGVRYSLVGWVIGPAFK